MTESLRHPKEDFELSWAASKMATEKLNKIGVLVVDDQPIMRTLVARMLTDIGVAAVHLASGAAEAIGLVKRGVAPLDLVICDLKMPDHNGFAFVAVLRKLADPAIAQLPVLILTGNATAANIESAVELGIHGVIAKPFTAAVLKDHVLQALASATMIDRDSLTNRHPDIADGAAPSRSPT